MTEPVNPHAFKALLRHIEDTKNLLSSLTAQAKEIEKSEFERLHALFQTKYGIDLHNFIQNVGEKGEYINVGYLYIYLGEDHTAKAKKLEELGFIQTHYVFYDPENESIQTEISKEAFLEYSTPDENGKYVDPLQGEICTKEEFEGRYYIYYSTTHAYTDFIKSNSVIFSFEYDL